MAQTKDPTQGNIELEPNGGPPTALGQIVLDGTDIKAQDGAGVFNLRSGSGLSEAAHRSVDQLVHAIAESSFDEYLYTGSRVDAVITWETAAKLKKIREELYTYSGGRVILVVTKHYDSAGNLLVGESMDESFGYTGQKLDDVTRTVT